MRPGSHSRPRQCGAISAHCVSVKVVRIKVASHLAALNQPAISLEILKRQHALVTMASAIIRFCCMLPRVAQDRHCLRDLAPIVGGLPASRSASHERPAIRDGISDNAPVRHSRLMRGKDSKLS